MLYPGTKTFGNSLWAGGTVPSVRQWGSPLLVVGEKKQSGLGGPVNSKGASEKLTAGSNFLFQSLLF